MMTDPRSARTRLDRRRLLQLAAGVPAALSLAACTDTSDVASQAEQTAPSVDFKIPANDGLPVGETKLRWVDSGDQKAEFFKPFFDEYRKVHGNVGVDYQGTNWNTIQQQVTLGLRNGTAPDVFQLPPSVTLAQAVENKWVGAFDDIVPDWRAVRSRFPAGTFANGVTDFDGKSYGAPVSSATFSNLLLYNEDLVAKAGHDFSKIVSWDVFRTALRDVTKQGDGKYYGIIMGLTQPGQLSGSISTLAQMAGVAGGIGGIDWRTGEYTYTHPIAEEAVELFLAINSDGSLFPGSTSIDAPGARGRFPQGVAAVILQGPWNIRPWTKADPNFPLALNIPPQRDPDAIQPIGYGPGGSNRYVYSSLTKAAPYIGDVWSYLLSERGQQAWAVLDGPADPAILPSSFDQVKLPELEQRSVEINKEHLVLTPWPGVRNPDVETVERVLKPLQPSFSDVCVGLLTGQLTGVRQQLKSLQDRADRALDEAIATARKRGADVSRDDYVFSDWDPATSYDKLYRS
ncbi:ABC transporter substrate-binding protein [Microlunatus sp. GCM10028923]|uniref:ABC transporter substrate-binding protein n=1 Tax=Microlunatus sp. GCM10028923 TaxID=3273400 RepID=UPI00362019F5